MADPEALARGVDGATACIHLASPSAWSEIVSADLDGVILDGTARLLRAIEAAGGARVVYVSTAAAVNGTRRPVVMDETAPFELEGSGLHYAVVKHRAEGLVLDAARRGLDALVVNPVETYGAGDDEWVTAGAIRDALTGWPALALHGGTSVAHVDDVADGICMALERGRAGERYILGGENVSVTQIVRLALELAGRRRPVVTLPAGPVRMAMRAMSAVGMRPPIAPGLVDYARRYWYMDSGKAVAELGYRFRPARDALADVVDWIARQGAEPVPAPP
jgi:dihydroflavonol-4-reductase